MLERKTLKITFRNRNGATIAKSGTLKQCIMHVVSFYVVLCSFIVYTLHKNI